MFFYRLFILILSLLLATAAFCLAFQTGQSAIAATNLALVKVAPEPGNIGDLYAQLESQVSRSPYNAELHSSLARVLVEMGQGEEAVAMMESALALRQKWPYDWMALAQLYADARIFDERMTLALQNLNRFGPSERSLIYPKAIFVMQYWYGLSKGQRALLTPSLQVVLENKRWARQFAVELEKMGRTQLFCRRFQAVIDYGPAWCAYFEKRARQRRASGA